MQNNVTAMEMAQLTMDNTVLKGKNMLVSKNYIPKESRVNGDLPYMIIDYLYNEDGIVKKEMEVLVDQLNSIYREKLNSDVSFERFYDIKNVARYAVSNGMDIHFTSSTKKLPQLIANHGGHVYEYAGTLDDNPIFPQFNKIEDALNEAYHDEALKIVLERRDGFSSPMMLSDDIGDRYYEDYQNYLKIVEESKTFLAEASKCCLDSRQQRIDLVVEFDYGFSRVYTEVMPSGTWNVVPAGIQREVVYSKEYLSGINEDLYMEILEAQGSPLRDEGGRLNRTDLADEAYKEKEINHLKPEVEKTIEEFFKQYCIAF